MDGAVTLLQLLEALECDFKLVGLIKAGGVVLDLDAEKRDDGKITLAELTRVLNGDNDLKDHLDALLGHFEPIDGIRTSYYLHTQVIENN